MVDDSNNSGRKGSGHKGWRERVGVKNGMPKLADDFKSEPKVSRGPAANTAQSARQPASRPAPRPVAAPAPMAPRRPVTPAPAAPPRASAPTTPSRVPTPAASRPAPKPPSAPVSVKPSDAFGDRLRAQREAAETLAARRAQETRERLASGGATSDGPKFTFADEEVKAAQPPASPPTPATNYAPQTNPTETPEQLTQRSIPTAPARPVAQTRPAPRTYQPSDAYRQTHGYRDYDQGTAPPRAPASSAPAAYDRYGDDRAAPPSRDYDRPPRAYSNNDQLGYADANEDMFESPQAAPRRAGASEYTAAYRDYDDAFEYDEEPRKRSGVWIFVVLMLLVVFAIAAGAYWFINFGSKIGGAKPASNVPTITAPQKPVKVTPSAPDTTAAPGQVKRKKIYDRILGDQTLEPEKLVPTEETPVQPVTPAPTTGGGNGPSAIDPLPLPLPPPPTVPPAGSSGGSGQQGNLSGKTNKVASVSPNTGQTVIAPTGNTASNGKSNKVGGQAAPLSLPPTVPSSDVAPTPGATPNVPTPSGSTDTAQPTTPQPPAAKPAPLPRSKPAIIVARARQAAEQSRLAALARDATPRFPTTGPAVPTVRQPTAPTQPLAQPLVGTGPVQISPPSSGSTNFNSGSRPTVTAPPPSRPSTNIASLPQPTPRIATPPSQTPNTQAPATTGSAYVIQLSSFRNREGANAEYRRLSSRHARILSGLQPQISEADLGASGKFYKLRLGSIASRSQAARLCNSLIAAGEKDCLVRKQ